MAYQFGFEVVMATIVPGSVQGVEHLGCVEHKTPSGTPYAVGVEAAIQCLAGPFADARFTGRRGPAPEILDDLLRDCGQSPDCLTAFDLCIAYAIDYAKARHVPPPNEGSMLAEETEAMLAWLATRTRNLVDWHWSQICAVAQDLLNRKTIDGKRIAEVVQSVEAHR